MVTLSMIVFAICIVMCAMIIDQNKIYITKKNTY